MKKIIIKLTMFCLVMIIGIYTANAAQKTKVTSTKSNGLRTIRFETPNGAVKMHLPDTPYAGDVISGTVIAEPAGKNEKQIKKNRNVLNGYVIEIEEKETPVSKEKEKWELPETIENGILRIVLKDLEKNILETTEIPVTQEPRKVSIPEALKNVDFKIPQYIRAGVPERIIGVYDGDFSTSAIHINDAPVEILAESPDGIYFETPKDITGPAEVKLTEGDFTMEDQTNVLDMELSSGKLTLNKGEQTQVHITVTGLEGLETAVPIELTNHTPENITMEGGNEQEIIIEPEDVPEDGTYEKDIDVTAVGTGGFSVEVEITPAAGKFLPGMFINNEDISETIEDLIKTIEKAQRILGNNKIVPIPPCNDCIKELKKLLRLLMINNMLDKLNDPHLTLVPEDWERLKEVRAKLEEAKQAINNGNDTEATRKLEEAKEILKKILSLPKPIRNYCIISIIADKLNDPHLTLVPEDWERLREVKAKLEEAKQAISNGNNEEARKKIKEAKEILENTLSLPKQTRDDCVEMLNSLLE